MTHTKFSHLAAHELVNMQDSVEPADQLDYLLEVVERLRQMEYQERVSEYEARLRNEKHVR